MPGVQGTARGLSDWSLVSKRVTCKTGEDGLAVSQILEFILGVMESHF